MQIGLAQSFLTTDLVLLNSVKGFSMVDQTKSIVTKLQQCQRQFTEAGSQFELTSFTRNDVEYQSYKHAPENLTGLYEMMKIHANKPFLVYQDQRLTFQQSYQQAATIAHQLIERFEIKKGQRVAIAMRNNPQWCIAFMAITAIGAVAVPLNGWWTGDELVYALDDADVSLVIVDSERLKRISSVQKNKNRSYILVAENPQADTTAWSDLLQKQYSEFPTQTITSDDHATILYTSGSTGFPKGALSSHRCILSALMSWALMSVTSASAGYSRDLTDPNAKLAALVTVPLFHVTGCHSVFLLSILSGRKMVLMHKWDPTDALRLIEKEQVSYFNGVPTMSYELVNHPNFQDFNTSSLIEVFAGGAACPESHAENLFKFPNLCPGAAYGLTETNGLGCVINSALYKLNPSSVGLVTPAVTEFKITDEQGCQLPTDGVGEIWIKSPANILGYWNNQQATNEAFDQGWFKTGDLGRQDKSGLIFINGRKKDIVVRGGENISCAEVESAIYEHPSVAEVAVFGVPCTRLGEKVCAAIHLNYKDKLGKGELNLFLAKTLSKFKLPEELYLSEKPLIRNATGKIDKRAIRDRFCQTLSNA